MSKFLFVPVMLRGHINPLVGVFQRLRADGHEIAIVARPGAENGAALAAQLARAGVECTWFPEVPDGELRASPSDRGFVARTLDAASVLRWHLARIERNLHPDRLAEVARAIDTFRPDVVCVDPMMYNGAVVAAKSGLPWAVISPMVLSAASPSWESEGVALARAGLPRLRALLAALDASFDFAVADPISPWLNVLFTTEAFLPRSLSGNRHAWYVGPSMPPAARGDEPEFPWERLSADLPIVLVSGGGGHSLSYDEGAFRSFARALEPAEGQLVLVLHDLVVRPFVRQLPSNVIAVRYAPQLRLLAERASAMITHGGLNTVTECLLHARPMLVVPLGYEQSLNGQAVETCGAGRMLPLTELTAEACRERLLSVLHEPRFADGAARVAASYRASDGARTSAELLARLAEERAPLPPPASSDR